MSSIEVGFESIAAETGELEDVAGSIRSQIAAAKSQAEQLSADWSGAAASTFQAAFAKWDDAADDCAELLERLIAGLHGTLADFSAREAANVAATQGLGTGIGSLGIAAMMGGS